MVSALAGLHLNPSDYEPASAQQTMMRNLRPTIAHVNRYWSSRILQEQHAGIVTLQDLISEASEILWKAATDYPAWARENQLDPYSGALFWAFARKKIDWGLSSYLRHRHQKTDASLEKLNGDDSADDWATDDVIRTQMSRHRPASMLQEQIADQIIMMRRDWRILIALRYFEELQFKQVGRLTGATEQTAINHINAICGQIRDQALTLVIDEPPFIPTPRKLNIAEDMPELEQYIWRTYGTDVSTWLGWIANCYRQDVAYITDLLQHGHITRHFGIIAHNRGLTDDQVREIRRLRQDGLSAKKIGEQLDLNESAVYLVHTGKTYVDVA